VNGNGEDFRQIQNSLLDPPAPMLVILA